MRVLEQTYDLDLGAYIVLDADERPIAGLPFCRHADLKGKRIVILPFSDYCDPLVEQHEYWHSLVARLVEEDCPISVRCVHNQVPLGDERFALVNQAKWHGPDLDTLYCSLPESVKRAIRKAEQSGVVVQLAGEIGELRDFFELHLKVRKYKYGLLAQPYSFFQNIWQQFVERGQGVLMVATRQDEIIGGVMFLEWKDGLYYKLNASAADNLGYRPNDALIWEGIKYAKGRGYSFLDFGLSDWDQEGLLRFKRKFATEEKTISFLKYCPRQHSTEQERQVQPLLSQLTGLLTGEVVPDDVTEKAGEILYRYFM
jgi:hypothetical protein